VPHPRLLSFVSGLTDPPGRRKAARVLANEVGAEDLLIFLPDADLGALLPAPGFTQTLPDGQRWREFLAACRREAPHHGSLPFSDPGAPMPAVGIAAECGAVLVLLGGEPRLGDAGDIALLLPLLAAAFRGERTALIAESNARLTSQAAEQARLLTASLDRARAALRKALSDAETANRAKDRFLAALSHELRTPLTPVLLIAAASESDAQLPESVRRDMATIRRNVELEVRLIDDLLDLSRVIAGKLPLSIVPLDLNTEVRHAIEICLPYIQEKGVRLTQDLAPGLGAVCADPIRVQQVLWNLFKNAVKFAPGGEVTVSTRLRDAGCVQVAVSDNGIGIEASALRRIFDAFEQASADTPREFGGLGLGLAISKALIDLHGGAIFAKSEGPGRGATFTIELPAKANQHPESRPAHLAAGGLTEIHARILIVEDHEDTARLLVRLLERSGHKVKTAGRVAAALELLETEPFDLLLSDVGLPDATGYELMQRAAERHRISGIAMTGYAMEDDVRKCREAGFSEHLVKPVNVQQLRQVIQRLMAESSSRVD
jgi:signal transduction histidine kinase